MIRGYATPPSISAGKKVIFHVAAFDNADPTKIGQVTNFRAYFFRRGTTWQYQDRSDVWRADVKPLPNPPNADPASPLNANDATNDWKWSGPGFEYEYTVPKDWRSGAYVAIFVPEERSSVRPNPDDAQYKDSRTLFVVTVAPEDPGIGATILYKVPLFTYCAYNFEGLASLYEAGAGDHSGDYRNFKATLYRPGCGLGGKCWDTSVDVYDPSSPRQTFSHWDAPFISWLESKDYKVDYCTDLDIHKNQDGFLQNYSLLLSVGHDEYWSQDMRTNVETFIVQGGNVAFFSGNTCWWRVELEDNNTALTCNKGDPNDPTASQDPNKWLALWRKAKSPETKLTGVSYWYGGGRWDGVRENVGFTVQNPDHWVYKDTGLLRGNTFGDKNRGPQGKPLKGKPLKGEDDEALVGYECDGAGIKQDAQGNYVLSHPQDNPDTFQILGVGKLSIAFDPPWEHLFDKDGPDVPAATLGVWEKPGQGTLFTAPTTDWARVLAVGDSTPSRKIVERITQNVLDKLQVKVSP